ncbi:MAG: ribonuclease HII [Clostridiales bacterium]|nr:ribonuclease HII [Clostridiales bacterium]
MSGSDKRETALQKAERMIAFDKEFGAKRLCGIDEAGRGPLAGPVSVCACVMPMEIPILGIDDSKKLSEEKREQLFDKITAVADYCVVLIDRATIDRINILEATKLGMAQAIAGLKIKPDCAVVDAVKGIDTDVKCVPVIKADAKSYCTAAASIIAKVTRDRLMRELDEKYPQYGFAKNKGYGTKAHIAAIKEYGACSEHRLTFIKNFIDVAKANFADVARSGEIDVR